MIPQRHKDRTTSQDGSYFLHTFQAPFQEALCYGILAVAAAGVRSSFMHLALPEVILQPVHESAWG
jgi:hypothetical protein